MLVIFDCDGVLVDSEPLSNAVLADALTAIGLPMTVPEAVTEFMGRSWTTCVARIEVLLGRPVPEELESDYVTARDAAFRRHLRPVEGVSAAIDAVEAAGLRTCVASSGDHAKMAFTLGLTGLRDRFDGRIFSALDVARGKPAPDLFLHAAARMGVASAHCVVVEDSPVGVQAAKAANMRTLGFTSRTGADALSGADEVFSSMAQLPGLVTAGCGSR